MYTCMKETTIDKFHIVGDWGEFSQRWTKFFNMAGIRGEPAATSSGSSTSTGKQNNGKKWHWNCAVALCTNNWRNKNLTYEST